MTCKSSKLGRTDLLLVCDQSSSVGLCMHDRKYLCLAVVNTQQAILFLCSIDMGSAILCHVFFGNI